MSEEKKKAESSKSESKSRGMGCVARLIAVIVVLIIIAVVVVRLMFPAERIRQEIVDRASAALGRTVEIDEVSLSLFPGLALDIKGLRIYNPPDFPGTEFVTVNRLRAGLKLMPLLRKQFVFSEISVVHPVIRLHKAADGRTNWSFTITPDEPIETPMGQRDQVSSEEAAMSAFGFDWAKLSGGDIIYTDDTDSTRLSLTNFTLDTRMQLDEAGTTGTALGKLHIPSIESNLIPEDAPLDLKLTYNASIDFAHTDIMLDNSMITINGIPFEGEATLRNFTDPYSLFVKLRAAGVEIEPLLTYIPKNSGFNAAALRLQGNLTGDIESRIEFASERKPYLSGRLVASELLLGYLTVNNRATFDSLAVAFSFDSVSFTSFGGSLTGRDFAVSGLVKNWDNLYFNLQTSGGYNLASAAAFLDPDIRHELRGMATFDLKLTGYKADWINAEMFGWFRADSGYYNNDSLTSPLTRLDLQLSFNRDKVKVDTLWAEYPGVRMGLSGNLQNGLGHLLAPDGGHPKPYLSFKLHAPLINYDELIPADSLTPEEAAEPERRTDTTTVSAPIFLPDIEAGGAVVVDTFQYNWVSFYDIAGDVSYKDGIITYTNATGRVLAGAVSSNGTVNINDMYNPVVKSEFVAKNVQANEFMEAFAGLEGHLYGKWDLEGAFETRGRRMDKIISSLNATGTVNMADGRIVNFDIIKKASQKLGFKTFDTEELNNLTSDVIIRDGRLILDGTKVLTDMGDWTLGGAVDMENKSLDLAVKLYLSPQYSDDFKALGNLLQDKQGRITVTFDITGDYKSPKISDLGTDTDVVKEKIEDVIKEGAQNLLDRFKKKK